MQEEAIKRIPPHNVEAERAVIGSMIMDADAILAAMEMLSADDFYQGQYGIIFDALTEMYKSGIGADLVTLQDKLREKEVPPELSSVEFIGGLIGSVPTSANIRHYAAIVHDKAMLRRLIQVTERISNNCYMDRQPAGDILDEAEKNVFDVLQKRGGSGFEPIRDIVLRTLDSIEKAAKQKGHITGLETGFRDLDYKTAGLQKSDLILIAARPAMGKTAFVLNIAEYMALHSRSTIAIFSLEMSKEQLVKRMLSMNSHVDSQKIRTGDLEDEDWDKLVGSVRKIGNSNLVIDDTSGITAQELRSKCRRLKIEKGLDLVIIDYLQLMSGAGKRNSSLYKNITTSASCSIAPDSRKSDSNGFLSGLCSTARESCDNAITGTLSSLAITLSERDISDISCCLFSDTEEKGVAEVIIAKQRSGPTGSVKIAWLSQFTKFGNLEISAV